MQVLKYAPGKIPNTKPCVMALGFFDGVHLGHRELLRVARDEAARLGISFGIFTFASDSAIKPGARRIHSDKEKCDILYGLGADFVVLADFVDIAHFSAEEFTNEVLIRSLNTHVAVAGFNYKFGRGASGTADDLVTYMAQGGRRAMISDAFYLDGAPISTTRIRAALDKGDMREVAALLGAPYHISGSVERGRGDGSRLGFPTVNTSLNNTKASPKRGVYRTAVPIAGRIYPALTNVGTCPTFDERELHLETYILNFEGDLYGETLDVYFLDFLREEQRFSSEKELVMQIIVDKNRVIKENGDITWQELGLN